MEEHLFSYENIFRNKDLNIDEEIRQKNQKERRPPSEDSNVPPEDRDPKDETASGFDTNKLIIERDEEGSSIQLGSADERKKGEKGQEAEEGDTSPGGEGRPSKADCKRDPAEPVEEESTGVANVMNAADVTTVPHVADAIVHTNSQTEPQSKKKVKNDISSLFADSASEVIGARGEPASDKREFNFWFSGKGATPRGEADGEANGEANREADGEADGEVAEENETHDNRLTTPRGNNPDGATNVKCKRGEDRGDCVIQEAPNGVDASIGDSNVEKEIRGDGGEVPGLTPELSSSDLVGEVSHPDRFQNGPSEKGEDAPRGDTSKAMRGEAACYNAADGNTADHNAAGHNSAGHNSAGDATPTVAASTAAPTALCFGTNGTFCYTRGSKVKCAPLICIIESGIRRRNDGSKGRVAPAPPSSNPSAKHSNSIAIRNRSLEEHVYAIRNFPGPFSRRTNKVDKKVINFLYGHMNLNEKRYGTNVYEYTQKSCLYQYFLNVMKNPHLLQFNLKDVRVDTSGASGAKAHAGDKRRNVVSYFVESSRQKGEGMRNNTGDPPHSGNGYPSGPSDQPDWQHDWSGDLRASEKNPREESGDQERRDSFSDVDGKGALKNNRTEMDKFEITGKDTAKRECPGGGDIDDDGGVYHGDDGGLYERDDISWRTSAYCREVPPFTPAVTWRDTNPGEKKKKKVSVNNRQYTFNDLVDPYFINAFSKMGIKEKITREDIYLEYYHLCIYNSEKAARLCLEKNLFRHFFLILDKYNDEKYRLMLSRYISHMDKSMNHDIEMTDGLKNIFRIYNPSVHDDIVKEAFVFLISLLNRESMTFDRTLLIDYWYCFYVLIYHNFLFQFEENEFSYDEYKEDIHRFFSFLIKQLYVHGRVTESQFLYLQLCGNPCVFEVAMEAQQLETQQLGTQQLEGSPLDSRPVEHPLWGGPHFDVLTFQMCEVIEYLNRSNEDNFFYEDLIRQKINYAFTLLELGVLEQAKSYIEIIYYYVDVIRSQKRNKNKSYYLVHLYESLLSQAKYVLPSLRLHNGGIFSTNWTASNEGLPEGGMYNYKVISPHRDLQHGGVAVHLGSSIQASTTTYTTTTTDTTTAIGGSLLAGTPIGVPPPNEPLSEGQNGSREGHPYYVPSYQQPSGNNVTMTPFEVKNPRGFSTDHVGSTHHGAVTGRISNLFRNNPSSPPHETEALTTNQNQYNERVESYSHLSFPPPPYSVATNPDQSNNQHDVSNTGTSITPHLANAPYPTDQGNSFLSSYHPPQMVVSGEGAEYTPVERTIPYHQYNGPYQNESAQVSYFSGGGQSMAEGALMSDMPDGRNSTAVSFQNISGTCNGGYTANWGGEHGGGHSGGGSTIQYDGRLGSAVGQDNYAYYYDASWNVVYPAAGSFTHATHQVQHDLHHTVQQVPHHPGQRDPHHAAHPPSGNNYPAGGGVPYGGNAKPPEPSGKSGPPEVSDKKTHSEKKKQADEQNGENNMDLINIGKTFISGFFSNIKEKIKMTEQSEDEEENVFYYDYEKKRWREKGVTSDEEEERERRKMQREMEIKNVAPPPQTENLSQANKNPLDIRDVRSRYVDYFN
ncbi:hypothetical protein C922_04183 [Plasmodium inui San Antonio 1]|uniref:Sec16 Sec23-binding domain-containing protein n=1 Tax=Plasmodium inui San Antonio 1 TaxID=1237626 RepID=W7A261_9APIC|nr:hypothetical protein C922_04183 [Plasmodium inui San Antonio 1]EUD65443.1 hypothetical protein C922_04183 [Plasmodium inui San Antonio 1]